MKQVLEKLDAIQQSTEAKIAEVTIAAEAKVAEAQAASKPFKTGW